MQVGMYTFNRKIEKRREIGETAMRKLFSILYLSTVCHFIFNIVTHGPIARQRLSKHIARRQTIYNNRGYSLLGN
jgi:hypothetical protein